MSQGMKQVLSQQMKMTPQQILLSSLLQLPLQQLEQRLKQELEMNPLLEEAQELEEVVEQEEELELEEEEKQELLQKQEKDEKEREEEQIKAEREKERKEEEEVDWDKFLNDENNFEVRTPRDFSSEEDESEWIQPDQKTLADFLIEQLRFTPLNEKEREIGEYIIWNINEDGYLMFDEPVLEKSKAEEIKSFAEAADDFRDDHISFIQENNTSQPVQNESEIQKKGKPNAKIDPIQAIAEELQTTNAEIEKVLKVVQSLDPPGIAARDLRECILIQLERSKTGFYDDGISLSIQIINEAYNDFINRRYDKVSRQLKIPMESIKNVIGYILQLNPKPGDGYIKPEQNYITPDVLIKKVNDKFEIILNDYGVPNLRINHAYKKMMLEKNKEKKEAKEFIKNKLEAAKWLINSIYRRRDTIYRTVETIVDIQKDFFEKGREFIKPMKLEDVALRIGMDISTISRATNGKYAQTDYGVFELKYFFSTGMVNSDGEDISTKQIKVLLKQVVDEEDKKKPLSDEDLAKILTERGTPIARRTITKYREQMMIPAARLRKEI
ncbi:RNA polymerase factor sigma-54 [bacterium]|nr:MAG: RNA polymerase factor sigma-54 [bacterium]